MHFLNNYRFANSILKYMNTLAHGLFQLSLTDLISRHGYPNSLPGGYRKLDLHGKEELGYRLVIVTVFGSWLRKRVGKSGEIVGCPC